LTGTPASLDRRKTETIARSVNGHLPYSGMEVQNRMLKVGLLLSKLVGFARYPKRCPAPRRVYKERRYNGIVWETVRFMDAARENAFPSPIPSMEKERISR
jgi:hypothetical protein